MQRTIASIFFDDLHLERPLYGGSYHLPAVAKGDRPFLLRVDDKIQNESMPAITGGGVIPRQILGEQISLDIIEHFTAKGYGMSVESAPGIWAVREYLPQLDEEGNPVMMTVFDEKGKPVERQQMRPATLDEKERMFVEDLDEARQRQHNYAEYLVNRGDSFHEDPDQRILITPRMKKAAVYLGRDVEWLKEAKHGDTRACPFCAKTIRSVAVKCGHCQEVVDYERFAAMEADRKEAIQEARKRRAA